MTTVSPIRDIAHTKESYLPLLTLVESIKWNLTYRSFRSKLIKAINGLLVNDLYLWLHEQIHDYKRYYE